MTNKPEQAAERTLEEQRQEFTQRRLMAMPLAGTLVWFIIGLAGLFLPERTTVWVLYAGTGSIAYLGFFLSRFTGENLLDKNRPKNTFDKLFFISMAMALLVFSIALPFAAVDHTSLPMTVGILTGLMWMPLSWIINHPVGILHTVSRTVLVLALWYLLPDMRFVAIPAAIVAVYIVTLFVLNKRWQALQASI